MTLLVEQFDSDQAQAEIQTALIAAAEARGAKLEMRWKTLGRHASVGMLFTLNWRRVRIKRAQIVTLAVATLWVGTATGQFLAGDSWEAAGWASLAAIIAHLVATAWARSCEVPTVEQIIEDSQALIDPAYDVEIGKSDDTWTFRWERRDYRE